MRVWVWVRARVRVRVIIDDDLVVLVTDITLRTTHHPLATPPPATPFQPTPPLSCPPISCPHAVPNACAVSITCAVPIACAVPFAMSARPDGACSAVANGCGLAGLFDNMPESDVLALLEENAGESEEVLAERIATRAQVKPSQRLISLLPE